MSVWYIYILECKDNTLYTGITNNLINRIQKHRDGKGAKYTKGRGPFHLIKLFTRPTKGEALKEEYRIKQLSKEEKLALPMTPQEKGEWLLHLFRRAPGMFSGSRESFLGRVSTILSMLEVNYVVIDFYAKHLGTKGCAYATWSEECEEEWGHQVIDDALSLLHKE